MLTIGSSKDIVKSIYQVCFKLFRVCGHMDSFLDFICAQHVKGAFCSQGR